MIEKELELYFSGNLKQFKTPLHLLGSDFQKKAWKALVQIPYGQTRSYLEQAKITGNDKAFRAVAKVLSHLLVKIWKGLIWKDSTPR